MGKKSPTPPPAPNYAAAAAEQGQANLKSGLQSAYLSNPNVYTPYGNQTVTWDTSNPDMPQATVRQTLTPEAQATLEAQQQVEKQLAGLAQTGATTAQDLLSKPFQYTGPQIQTSIAPAGNLNYGPSGDQFGTAKGIDAGLYGRALQQFDTSKVAAMPINAGMTAQQAIMSRLQPQIAQQGAATAQQLANQGITPGSEAYNNAMRMQQQQFNDLYTQAALQGINLDLTANEQGFNQAQAIGNFYNQGQNQNFSQGLSAQQLANQAIAQNYGQAAQSAGLYNQAIAQKYNQDLQAAQFANNAAQQAMAQQLQLRNQPLNEISALMSGSQIQAPQFQAYSGQNVAAAPTFQAAQLQNQYGMDVYGQQMAARNAAMQGLGSAIGGVAGMFAPIKL